MIKKIFLTLILLLIIFSSGCQNKSSETIKIGAVLPLTGPIAQNGKYYREGLELALDNAVRQGVIPKDKVELVIEDGQADPAKCVDAFTKMINVDGIIAGFGSTSGVTLALKPIANQNHIVLINASAISTQIEDSADYCFSVLPNAKTEGYFLAEFCHDSLKKRTAGILYRNDASGESFETNFAHHFEELGGKVTFLESHQPDQSDFRSYISKIAGTKGIEILFMASFWTETSAFARQAAELGLKLPIITYETFNNPKVFDLASDAANGIMFCASAFDINSPDSSVKYFAESFREKYKQTDINYYVGSYYDGMTLLLKAITGEKTTGSSIEDYLRHTKVYRGVTGEMTFDNKGAVSVPLAIYVARNYTFTQYQLNGRK